MRLKDELVRVVCRHTDPPRTLGRVIRGAIVWLPSCTDDRGRMRPHIPEHDRIPDDYSSEQRVGRGHRR